MYYIKHPSENTVLLCISCGDWQVYGPASQLAGVAVRLAVWTRLEFVVYPPCV